jgi:hypothetical protein
VRTLPEVIGVSAFVLNAMRLTHEGRTAMGGDAEEGDPASVGQVLDWPEPIIAHAFPLDPRVHFIDRLPVLLRPRELLLTGSVVLLSGSLATTLAGDARGAAAPRGRVSSGLKRFCRSGDGP